MRDYIRSTVYSRKALPAGVVSWENGPLSPRHMVGHTTPFLCQAGIATHLQESTSVAFLFVEAQSTLWEEGWASK